MAGNDAHDHRSAARRAVEDALGRLEERLDRASQAAERLLADAVERVTGASPAIRARRRAASRRPASRRPERARGRQPPPAGWQQAGPSRDRAPPLLGDGDLLLGLFAAVRDRIPPDLQQRLAEAVREVLLALRALIDWYLERTERARSGPPRSRTSRFCRGGRRGLPAGREPPGSPRTIERCPAAGSSPGRRRTSGAAASAAGRRGGRAGMSAGRSASRAQRRASPPTRILRVWRELPQERRLAAWPASGCSSPCSCPGTRRR